MKQNGYVVAVLADIHGLLPPLEAVLLSLESNPPDEIIIAGDFLGGPQPVEVLERLQSLNSRFILGNGEVYLLRMHRGCAPEAWWTHRQFDVGRWIYHHISPEFFGFLQELKSELVLSPEGIGCPIRVVHGSPWDVNHLIFPDENPQDLSRALAMIPEAVLVFAHNHLPGIYYRDGKVAINPGSVGNNLNGELRSSYTTLTWDGCQWVPELHYVDFDFAVVVDTFKNTGFLEANRPLARAFLESIITGQNTTLHYIEYAQHKAINAGYNSFETVPDDIWINAETDFDWQYQL